MLRKKMELDIIRSSSQPAMPTNWQEGKKSESEKKSRWQPEPLDAIPPHKLSHPLPPVQNKGGKYSGHVYLHEYLGATVKKYTREMSIHFDFEYLSSISKGKFPLFIVFLF